MNTNALGHQAAGIPQHSQNVKRSVKRSSTQKPHWRLSKKEARALFEMGVFNATTYLLALLKCHGAAGWKWSFRVADFCNEYGFQRSTFYCALSKLRAKQLIFWSGAEKVTVWWQDIGVDPCINTDINNCQENDLSSNDSNQDGSKAVQIVGHSVQDVGHSVQDVGHSVQDVGQQIPEMPQNQGLHQPSRFSSNFSSNPPHPHPPHPPEEEQKFLKNKEEESAQNGVVEVDQHEQSPPLQQEEAGTRQQHSVEEKSTCDAASCFTHPADEDSFIQWVEEVYLPTTKDYQAGNIRNLRRYALKVIQNAGDALRQDWLKSQKQASWNAYCLEIEAKVRARALEWEAVGRHITHYHQLEDGMPAVAIDGHTHVAAPDFLRLPVDHKPQTDLPVAAQSLLQLLRLRPGRQQKLNNFEAWARLGDFQVESYWIDVFLTAWEDSALRSQIQRIISAHPALGLIVDGDALLEDF